MMCKQNGRYTDAPPFPDAQNIESDSVYNPGLNQVTHA